MDTLSVSGTTVQVLITTHMPSGDVSETETFDVTNETIGTYLISKGLKIG